MNTEIQAFCPICKRYYSVKKFEKHMKKHGRNVYAEVYKIREVKA